MVVVMVTVCAAFGLSVLEDEIKITSVRMGECTDIEVIFSVEAAGPGEQTSA